MRVGNTERRTASGRLRTVATAVAQAAVLALVSVVGDELARALHLPFPGSLIGLGLVFAVLAARIVPLSSLEAGASLLLDDLLLLFIPASLGILQYGALVRRSGLDIFLTVLLGTVLVMCVAGGVAELVARRRRRGV